MYISQSVISAIFACTPLYHSRYAQGFLKIIMNAPVPGDAFRFTDLF